MNGRCVLLVPLLMLASVAAAADASSDQRFLAGLRERGLFELAETYCLDRLGRENLPESQRADLVIELSRTLAEWAASSPPDVRPPLWQRALQVTEDFARGYPQSPRLLLVRLQGALGLLGRGELARQEAEVLARQGNLLDEARTHLRAAIRQLGELADEVDRRLGQPNLSDRAEPTELPAQQLISLQKNIQYQLARALRNQAQCYAGNSPDRANSLTQAVKLLTPLANLDAADPLAFKSRIDLIVSHRLLADYDTARQRLDALLRQKPPPAVELRARAEWIHLALATRELPEAITVLSKGRELDGVTSAELDYAWLGAYLAAWRAAADAKDNAKAAQWQNKATAMVRVINSLYGPYWTRRAEMLLAGYVRSAPESGDLAMLVQAAESSFRSGRLDDALNAYDRARALAAKQGDADRAFDLGYVAAAIEHRRGRHDQALARYRRLSTATPSHPKAAEAHLLAIYHAGQIAKSEKSPKDSLGQYEDLLQEHLQVWKAGPSAEGVRRRLGRLYEHQRRWKNAIDEYQAISPGDAEYLQAVEATARCYRRWLDERKAAGESAGQTAAGAEAAAAWFESIVFGPRQLLPERWSPVQRLAALAAARFRLRYTPAGYARAQTLLSAALKGAADAPPQWKSAAQALLVVSLAAEGRSDEAAELLRQIPALPSEDLLDMLRGLEQLLDAAWPEVPAELVNLQDRADNLLRPPEEQLSRSEKRALEEIRAWADARLLLTRRDRPSLETALKEWRELEKKCPPRSRQWFRAKYRVAWLHCELGNKQQAAKIITLLQLLHPEMGSEEMKRHFEQLLRRCQE